jgi:hypothetical protein
VDCLPASKHSIIHFRPSQPLNRLRGQCNTTSSLTCA